MRKTLVILVIVTLSLTHAHASWKETNISFIKETLTSLIGDEEGSTWAEDGSCCLFQNPPRALLMPDRGGIRIIVGFSPLMTKIKLVEEALRNGVFQTLYSDPKLSPLIFENNPEVVFTGIDERLFAERISSKSYPLVKTLYKATKLG